MVQGVVSLSSPLEAVQHVIDVAYNAYNTRMVTVSDGDCISISEKGSADGPLWKEPTASWRSSVGPLLKVAVGHPENGQVVVVGTADGALLFYEELLGRPGRPWELLNSLQAGRQAINAIAFAPRELGALVAAASGDGWCRLYEPGPPGEGWSLQNEFQASSSGACTALSWRSGGSDVPPLLLVGTSHGAQVRVHNHASGRWEVGTRIPGQAAVKDAAWAPPLAREQEIVALCGASQLSLWGLRGPATALEVEKLAVFEHPGGFWKLAWNLVGTCLAASTEDGQVQLYSPNMLQEWRLQGSLVGSLDAPDVEAPA